MKSEEIIKALLCTKDHVFCSECAYYGIMGCRNQVRADARDLILRLIEEKEQVDQENEDMHGELMSLRAYIDNHEEVWKSNAEAENKRFVKNMQNVLEIEKEQIRKDTAKDFFHDIYQMLSTNYVDEEIGYQDECIDTACLYEDLKEIAKKHGVEVDDE